MERYADFAELKGVTLKSVKAYYGDSESIVFESEDKTWHLYHTQDCCENVYIESIIGDLNDLVGTPILLAELATSDGREEDDPDDYGSSTWSFYKLATIKGSVTIRWYGSSNGYYSETVDFMEITYGE